MFVPLRSNISLRVRQWTWFRQNTSGTFQIGMKNHRPCKYKCRCKNPTTGLCPGALPALRSTTICVYIYIYIINRPSKSTNPTHTHQMFRLTKSRPPCQTARWGKRVELTWYPSCVPISKSDPGQKGLLLRWWGGHTHQDGKLRQKFMKCWSWVSKFQMVTKVLLAPSSSSSSSSSKHRCSPATCFILGSLQTRLDNQRKPIIRCQSHSHPWKLSHIWFRM